MTSHRRRIMVALALCMALPGCGDDDEPTSDPVRSGGLRGATAETEAPEECVSFCEKANQCARQEGRPIPPAAADCRRGCAPGGPHRAAPARLWQCATEPCGDAFRRCTLEVMMTHMQAQDVAVFPPICEGLCNKSAWCARQRDQPLGPGEQDCAAACRPGGAYVAVADRELLCAGESFPCGPLFETCRRRGGPESTPPSP